MVDTSELIEGFTVNSYSAMCKILKMSPKSGIDKEFQIKEWESYFNFDMKSNKFIIKEIYSVPIGINPINYFEYYQSFFEKFIIDMVLSAKQISNTGESSGLYFKTEELIKVFKNLRKDYNYYQTREIPLVKIILPKSEFDKGEYEAHYKYYVSDYTEDISIIKFIERIFSRLKNKSGFYFNRVPNDCYSIICGLESLLKRKHEIQNTMIQIVQLGTYVYELRNMYYKDYLETKHWKNLRIQKLESTHYECEECGSEKCLQIHHKTYENRGCEPLSDLQTLCQKCHSGKHKNTIHNTSFKGYIEELLNNEKDLTPKLFIEKLINKSNELLKSKEELQ